MQRGGSVLRDRDFVQMAKLAQNRFKGSVAGALHRTPKVPRGNSSFP
jgi:hypothetical protein